MYHRLTVREYVFKGLIIAVRRTYLRRIKQPRVLATGIVFMDGTGECWRLMLTSCCGSAGTGGRSITANAANEDELVRNGFLFCANWRTFITSKWTVRISGDCFVSKSSRIVLTGLLLLWITLPTIQSKETNALQWRSGNMRWLRVSSEITSRSDMIS